MADSVANNKSIRSTKITSANQLLLVARGHGELGTSYLPNYGHPL